MHISDSLQSTLYISACCQICISIVVSTGRHMSTMLFIWFFKSALQLWCKILLVKQIHLFFIVHSCLSCTVDCEDDMNLYSVGWHLSSVKMQFVWLSFGCHPLCLCISFFSWKQIKVFDENIPGFLSIYLAPMDSKRLKVKITVSVQLQRAINDTRRWIMNKGHI